MSNFKQFPRKIKYLEVISRALLLILPFSIVFVQTCSSEYEFYVFYKNIIPIVWVFPLLLAIVLEIVSISLQKKSNLLVKQSLRNFLKLLLLMAFISGLTAILLYAPCGSRIKARDARIVADISQARTIMVSVYENNGNYDNFNCEYGDMFVICQDIDRMYEKKPLIGIRDWYAKDRKQPIIIHDAPSNSQAVCIYSPLNIKKNYWYCADSSGRVETTEVNPNSPGYCIEGENAVCPQ